MVVAFRDALREVEADCVDCGMPSGVMVGHVVESTVVAVPSEAFD